MAIILQLLALFVVGVSAHGFVQRDTIDENCALVKKDCIKSGEIFKKSIVCASNGKRFINQCSLQLRACDLYFDTGEVLVEERCFWIDKEEQMDQEEEENEEEDEEEDEEEEVGSGQEETKETSTVMENFYTTEETMTSSNQARFTTTESIEDSGSNTQYSYSQDSDNSDFIFHNPAEEISGNTPCSCRGDSICPSCDPFYKKTRGPVCGSDGKTYKTECDMDNHRCATDKFDLHMDREGDC